jgi:glycosyltransferase involved in cell wall biosynthesis
MASIHVRGLCLEGYAPQGWDFKFIHGPKDFNGLNFFTRLKTIFFYVGSIRKAVARDSRRGALYFIKPNSIFLLAICRLILRFKIYIDINDPIHLPEQMGRFAGAKVRLMLQIANGIIFESLEYEKFTHKWRRNPTRVIEDTAQFEISFINYKSREKNVVWFGSPSTSKVLIQYIEHLKKLNDCGFSITLLGADAGVVKILSECGIQLTLVKSYDHEKLVEILSNTMLSFVPMPNIDSYSLRGNLKAKFAMASGCITIASDLNMHRRLIVNGVTGYIFSNINDFSVIVENISKSPYDYLEKVGHAANINIVKSFNRKSHAEEICKFIGSSN